MSMQILTRDVPPRSAWALEQAGIHPLLSRLFAARGVVSADELDDGLAKLLAPSTLKGSQAAAVLLADAIAANKRICIVADYDCDGATACAVGLRGLRMLGAKHVNYIVPDRVVDGYGLTAPIAQRVKQSGADVLVTVDNGIASLEGVAQAQALGLQVLVTDHHLPAATLPDAEVIVKRCDGYFEVNVLDKARGLVNLYEPQDSKVAVVEFLAYLAKQEGRPDIFCIEEVL